MHLDFLLVGKLFLMFYIWLLIAFCILFIFNSRKVYQGLKNYELLFLSKKREVIHSFAPMMLSLSKHSKSIQMALQINRISLKDFLLLIVPFTFNGFSLFRGIKYELNLIKKLFKLVR